MHWTSVILHIEKTTFTSTESSGRIFVSTKSIYCSSRLIRLQKYSERGALEAGNVRSRQSDHRSRASILVNILRFLETEKLEFSCPSSTTNPQKNIFEEKKYILT